MRTSILPLLLTTFLLAPAALAQTAINETRPLDARGRVDISNIKGRIEVRGWERNEVQVTGTLGKGVEKLDIDGSGPQVSIEVRYPKGGWGGDRAGPTDLVVMVPLRADLDIESVAADVHVDGVASSELSISSVSGSVFAAAKPTTQTVSTLGGKFTTVGGRWFGDKVDQNATLRAGEIIFENEGQLEKSMALLSDHEIGSRRYFFPGLNHLDYTSGETPVSDSISSRVLCLPLYHGLSKEEQKMIARILLRVQNNL